MRRNVSTPRTRSFATMTAAALLCGALVLAPPVSANPLPMAAVFTHVEAHQAEFCAGTAITSCDQIVQVSGATGLVDFDLFYEPVGAPPEPIESFSLQIAWSDHWTFQALDVCCGTYEFTPTADGMTLTIDVDPGHQADQFFPIARVTLAVPVAGRLTLPESEVSIGGTPLWILGVSARAGVPCGDCVQRCDFGDDCTAGADLDLIEMTVPQGGTVSTQFHGWVSGMNPMCDGGFSSTENWLAVNAMPSPTGGYDVFVTADASGLSSLGTYEAAIHAWTTWPCTTCIQVLLTVTTATPAHEETWGRIKHQFR